jgi:hypothetical protein
MTSVLSGISQNSRSGSHLVVFAASTSYFLPDLVQGTTTLAQAFATSAGTTAGVVRADGGNIVFDTTGHAAAYCGGFVNAAAVTTAITNYTQTAQALPAGTVLRDIGKNIYVYVNTNGVPALFCVLTRVDIVNGAVTEGESANNGAAGATGTTTLTLNGTGYVATWAAATAVTAGNTTGGTVKIGVARIGSGHAF